MGVVLVFGMQEVVAQEPDGGGETPLKVANTEVGALLKLLGAKLEDGLTLRQFEDYQRHFSRVDHDGDGNHSKVEFIEKGTYMTPQARRGIFTAADADSDGLVTRAEYLLNRIITDEAKAIMQAMDGDRDRAVQREEFLKGAFLADGDRKRAAAVFEALDTNGDGETRIPEYLRVWGKWARSGRKPAAERVSVLERKLRRKGEKSDRAKSK